VHLVRVGLSFGVALLFYCNWDWDGY